MGIYYQKMPKSNEEGVILSIEISKISANPNQPRRAFPDDAILKLADSIRQYGILQPLCVRRMGDGYELISGERRLRASKELGMTHVPCVLMEIDECQSAEISIIENLMREDLNIFEQAMAIEALIDTYGLTQEQIARRLSNSQSFVANKLRLLRLSESEREKILENGLTERHARALLRILDPELRDKVLSKIIEDGLNVSRTEELIEQILSKNDPKRAKNPTPIKDMRSFYASIDRLIDSVKLSGIDIKSRIVESDAFTELTILIPSTDAEPATV
ncbi:MAG: ParB/RepB/Spo0J family partition protein [Clostridia bacterium]|nr:ParB/RepB/Spo0J family partition protein [Clostridia bacterium]